jgi:hypothetical protein
VPAPKRATTAYINFTQWYREELKKSRSGHTEDRWLRKGVCRQMEHDAGRGKETFSRGGGSRPWAL